MKKTVEERKASYKKTAVSAEDGRRRRDETKLQIRKTKKEERLAKRRASNNTVPDSNVLQVIGAVEARAPPKVSDLPLFVSVLLNPTSNPISLLNATRDIRRLLSIEDGTATPFREIIESGILPRLVSLLGPQCDNIMDLQFEAAWALTNVASSQYTQDVVNVDAIPALTRLLESPKGKLREQSAWCLGNIAGDCPTSRDMVLLARAGPKLCRNVQSPETLSLLANVVWAISNLCRGKPPPELSQVIAFIPPLVLVISKCTHPEVRADACWSLSYLSDGGERYIDAVIEGKAVPDLINMLTETKSTMLTPALRALSNIVSGNERQTQVPLDLGLLEKLNLLLGHRKRSVRKEVCFLLSNVAAGTVEQISQLMAVKGLIGSVVEVARSGVWEVRKEAIWFISNIFTSGNSQHVQTIVDYDGVRLICDALQMEDARVICTVLDAIECILREGQKQGHSTYAVLVDECGGLDKIEELQTHSSDVIYNKVVHIIDEYFGGDEDQDENLAPATDGNTFGFGLTSKNLFGNSRGDKFDFGNGNSSHGFN